MDAKLVVFNRVAKRDENPVGHYANAMHLGADIDPFDVNPELRGQHWWICGYDCALNGWLREPDGYYHSDGARRLHRAKQSLGEGVDLDLFESYIDNRWKAGNFDY